MTVLQISQWISTANLFAEVFCVRCRAIFQVFALDDIVPMWVGSKSCHVKQCKVRSEYTLQFTLKACARKYTYLMIKSLGIVSIKYSLHMYNSPSNFAI